MNVLVQRPKPVADQVNAILRGRIRDRSYPPGGRLPSESELAQELGVSRATVRTALAKLAAEGLILRKQGDGTYVNERIREVDTRYGGVWDFSRLIEANGYRPSIRTLATESRKAKDREATALAIEPGEPVFSMARLFLADDRPAIYVSNAIPMCLITSEIDPSDTRLPIHQFMQRYCREEIAYAITDVEATLVGDGPAAVLARKPDNPTLKLVVTFYSKKNQPLVFGESYYDHTILRLRLVQAWG